MELITASQNLAFTVAIVIMFVIALMEGVGMILGVGIFAFMDTLLPDLGLGVDVDMDLDVGVDLDISQNSPPAFSRFLGWLRVGQVPILVLLIVFLTAFGLLGLSMQAIVYSMTGHYLPGTIAWLPILLATLPLVRVGGGLLAMVIPQDETDAVAESTFIGRIAVITIGVARWQYPAQAKLKDEHGQSHYVMVEPLNKQDEFPQGIAVLLTQQHGSVFRAVANTHQALVDQK